MNSLGSEPHSFTLNSTRAYGFKDYKVESLGGGHDVEMAIDHQMVRIYDHWCIRAKLSSLRFLNQRSPQRKMLSKALDYLVVLVATVVNLFGIYVEDGLLRMTHEQFRLPTPCGCIAR